MKQNTKSVGEVSEAVILAELVKRGYPVSIPFGNNQRYDLIVEEDGNLLKVQVKTAWDGQNGCLVFNTSSVNGFTKTRTTYELDADIFLVYYPLNEKIYRIPANKALKSSMQLRLNDPICSMKTINWAEEFEF